MAKMTDMLGRNGKWVALGIALIAVGAALLAIYLFGEPEAPEAPEPVEVSQVEEVSTPDPEPEPIEEPQYDYPVIEYMTDKLFVTEDRAAYEDGDLWLSIPRVDYEGPVLAGVDEYTLTQGIGLYDYAQLPSWGNPNTSIAGHRDIYGCEFYYLDTVQEGDLIYLTWQGSLYTYEYLDTVVVNDDDWSVIYCTDKPIVTLTTCTPIGTSDYRMIVTAELISIRPLSEEELAAR